MRQHYLAMWPDDADGFRRVPYMRPPRCRPVDASVAEKLSVNFSAAAAHRSSSVYRSKRLFSVNLAHYVTDTGRCDEEDEEGASSDESEGDVMQVTMSDDAEPYPPSIPLQTSREMLRADIKSSLLACNGLRFDDISTAMQERILAAMIVDVVSPGGRIVTKGEGVDGIVVVISEGTAVSDAITGEWYSRGKMFNIESLAFDQHVSPYTLRAGEKPVHVATLPRADYDVAEDLRVNYLRSKYSILDTLSDRTLRAFRPAHHWVQPNEPFTLHRQMVLMTHGVARIEGVDKSERLFPGQTVGVCELMQNEDITLQADTFAGFAVIDRSRFKAFMRESAFMESINDIIYQRSVVMENYEAAPAEEEEDSDSDEPLVFTDAVCKSYDGHGDLIINQYKVVKKIGAGATAGVFMVTDRKAGRSRVMKIVKREGSVKSIRREIDALRTFCHPHVIRAYDIIDCLQSTVVMIVQELAEWGSLLGVKLEMRDAKGCALGVVKALQHVHGHGLIHGDVKPANVLRNKHGRIKLADFGCTTRVDEPPDSRPAGTPAFMAPEVMDNRACQASDVWALTVTIYCVIYGVVPFGGDTKRSLREAVQFSEIPLQHIGASEDETNLYRLCEEGLTRDPRRRITLGEFEEHDWLRHNPPRTSFTRAPHEIEALPS